MATAATREEALVALAHAQHALGDRHCGLSPPTDLRSVRLSLGVDVFASYVGGGKPVVRIPRVTDPELAAKVSVGDEIVAVDGVPMVAYLARHPFESSALNPNAALEETASSAVHQTTPWTTVKEGDARTRGSRGAIQPSTWLCRSVGPTALRRPTRKSPSMTRPTWRRFPVRRSRSHLTRGTPWRRSG